MHHSEGHELPLVSVVIPNYNYEKYVEKAVLSVVHQTYKNIELIVVDDGSTDESVSKLRALQNKYGFVFSARSNHGHIQTVDYAFKNLVNGEYSTWLDADDYWHHDKITRLVNYMQKHSEYAMVHGSAVHIDGDDVVLSVHRSQGIKEGDIFKAYVSKQASIHAATTFFKTEVILEVDGWNDECLCHDVHILLKVLSRYPVGYMADPLTYYRLHNENMSKSNKINYFRERECYNSWQDNSIVKASLPKYLINWLNTLSKSDKEVSRKIILECLHHPEVWVNPGFYNGLRRYLFR